MEGGLLPEPQPVQALGSELRSEQIPDRAHEVLGGGNGPGREERVLVTKGLAGLDRFEKLRGFVSPAISS